MQRITAADLAEQREAVPEKAFRRFHANQWTERVSHWLPPGAWRHIQGEPDFTPGEPVSVGVDVGGDKSASAVVWINEALTGRLRDLPRRRRRTRLHRP